MASNYDFRVIINTVSGSNFSYGTASLVSVQPNTSLVVNTNTMVDKINTMKQINVFNGKTHTTASSLFKSFDIGTPTFFSGSTGVDTNYQYLSASIKGNSESGSILFHANDTPTAGGDFIKRYKFFGNKVCNVLGVPENYWIYADKFRLTNTGSESNYISGDILAQSLHLKDNFAISNAGAIESDLPMKHAKDTDRWIKWTDVSSSIPQNDMLIGYSNQNDRYEIRMQNEDLLISSSATTASGDFKVNGTAQVDLLKVGAGGNIQMGNDTDGILLQNFIQSGFSVSNPDDSGDHYLTVTPGSVVLSQGGSQFLDIQGTTDASDATGDTGALRVEGGASIAKKVFVGTDLNIGGKITSNITASGNISSSGKVIANEFEVIGNTTAELEVNGHITASGDISASGTGIFNKLEINNPSPTFVLKDTTDDDDHIIEFQDNTGNVDYKIDTTGDIFNIRAIANSPMRFTTNNTERMRILNDGNVGIGTDTPLKKLHINNSGILIDGGSTQETGDLATRFVIDAGDSTGHQLMDLRNISGSLLFVDGNNDPNNFARVGIGITDPVDPLQVLCDTDGHGLSLEENDGGETYQLGVDSSGDLNFYNSQNTTPVMKLDDNGDLGIGTGDSNPSARLTVKGNSTNVAISASGLIRFTNDHFTPGGGTPQMQLTRFGDNGGNNDGLVISYLGFDRTGNPPTEDERFLNFAVNNGSDSNIYIARFIGDGEGGIETTGIAFTGRHPSVMNSGSYELGMIVESTGEVWAKSNTGVGTGIPKVQISTTDSSKKVFGVIGEWSGDYDGYAGLHGVGENEIDISINSLGEGLIWVTNKNGNIENGDFIVSSVISGYGQQQNDDLLRSSTVAKCTETIDWDNVTETITYNGVQYKKYLCTCTYHCG